MRKALIFLLAFGVGFALLWTFRTPEVDGGNGPAPAPSPEEPPPTIQLPSDEESDTIVRFTPAGRFEYTYFYAEEDGGGRQYYFVAEDTRHLGGGVYELTDLHVDFYEAEGGALLAEADSSLSEVRIETDEGGTLDFGEELSLTNVELTMHRGMPVVPITVRVPRLIYTIAEGRFRSTDLVQVHAQGVEASGTGLVVDTELSSLRLVQDGRIELELERGGTVVLEAIGVGPIDFLRHGTEDAPSIEIRAQENARFTLQAENEVAAVGDQIVIRASSQGGPERRRFRATEAFVTGDAVVESGGSVFRSRRADVAFDEAGVLSEVRLVGEPTGRVELARFLDEREAGELQATYADVRGQGPLRVTFGTGTGFDLLGPGEIVVPEQELTMSATERIVGYLGPERAPESDEGDGGAAAAPGSRAGEIEASGNVVVLYAGRRLESDALAMRYATTGPGEEAVDLDTDGPTRVTGTDDAGREVLVVAEGGGTFRVRGERVRAPIVRGVRLETRGEGGYVARAAEVRDFDWQARTFVAEGDVVYETAEARATGARAVAVGPEEIELYGAADPEGERARFTLWAPSVPGADDEAREEQGRIEARKVVLSEGRASATEDVECTFAPGDERYRLLCERLDLAYDVAPVKGRRAFQAHAREGCRIEADAPSGAASMSSNELDVEGVFLEQEPAATIQGALGRTQLVARGDVEIDFTESARLRGRADRFTIDERGQGRLSMDGDGLVWATGSYPGEGPYEMTAEWIEFDRERVRAHKQHIYSVPERDADRDEGSSTGGDGGTGAQEASPDAQQGTAGTGGDRLGTRPSGRALVHHVRSNDSSYDQRSMLLDGEVFMDGVTEEGEPWSIEAGAIQTLGDFDPRSGRVSLENVELFEARGGFTVKLGERMAARGRKLSARPGRIRLEGAPARFEVADVAWESDWIEIDPDNLLVGTGRGRLRPSDPTEDWTLSYESMQPFDDVDSTLLVLRNPLFVSGGSPRRELRAGWALFWLDKSRWTRSTSELIRIPEGPEDLHVNAPTDAPQPGGSTDEEEIQEYASLLNEIYIEGNIEFLEDDRRVASAQAYYLNRLDGHGWMQDANVLMDLERSGRTETVRVKARWMRVTADLDSTSTDLIERIEALRADQAVITTCTFEEPHYVIETGDLRIRRNVKSAVGYDFSARKNRARFINGLVIPLPPLDFGTDEQGNPTIGGFDIGNSARFGSMISATANLPLPDWSRKLISTPLSLEDTDVTGGTRTSLGYLSSRGFLFGVGQQIRASDRLWLDVYYDAVPDSGTDLGLVRSKTLDGNEYRDWLHARGRLLIKPGEWIDLAFTRQQDAGFQSEFFEKDYLLYEQQDNYLHWRKADDTLYYDASAAVRVESFRDYVEELPSGGAYLSPTRVASFGDHDLLYSASARAGYYRRRLGTDPRSPFGPVFGDADFTGDGFADDAEIARFDTLHRVEMPFSLGVLGLRATPYLEARGTAWDRGAEDASSPARYGGFAGVHVATSFLRRFKNGSLHQIAPSVGVRTELAYDERGDTPVQLDRTEDSIEGHFVDLGLRTVWWKPNAPDPGKEPWLDLEVRATHGTNTATRDGWQPIRVLGNVVTYAGDVPVGLAHDGRYDVDDEEGTVYSFTGVGFEPVEDLGFELGYNQGKQDGTGSTLFRSASIGTRYRASQKWEFAIRHSISLLDDGGLFTGVLVRRIGHDFVTELEFEDRAGEGTAIGLSLKPRFAWKRRALGLIDNWLGVYR